MPRNVPMPSCINPWSFPWLTVVRVSGLCALTVVILKTQSRNNANRNIFFIIYYFVGFVLKTFVVAPNKPQLAYRTQIEMLLKIDVSGEFNGERPDVAARHEIVVKL